MGNFRLILNTGTNGQNERKRWSEISKSKGKMPKLIYQAETRAISKSLLQSKQENKEQNFLSLKNL